MRSAIIVLFAMLAGSFARTAMAEWSAGGSAVCVLPGSQSPYLVAPDASGGGFVLWADNRNGTIDAFAQHFDAYGCRQWASNGLPVFYGPNSQFPAGVVADGSGGVIAIFGDSQFSPTLNFAQHIDGAGNPLWSAPVRVIGANAVTDGEGGAIVFGSGFAQRIAGDGTVVWDSVVVSGVAAPDGLGGVVFASGVRAQRLDHDGQVLWGPSGSLVCSAPGQKDNVQVACGGDGSAIVAWWDWRSGMYPEVYVQKVSANGNPQWTLNGVPLGVPVGNGIGIAADLQGGAFVVSGGNARMFALDSGGVIRWYATGCTQLCAPYPAIVPDGQDGVIVVTHGLGSLGAQRYNHAGQGLWTPMGVFSGAVDANDPFPLPIAADGKAGVLLGWPDIRNYSSTNRDIYFQRIASNGDFHVDSIPGGSVCNPIVGSGTPLNQRFTVSALPLAYPGDGCCPCWRFTPPSCPPGSQPVRTTIAGAPAGIWSCDCWRYYDPPYVDAFDYELSSESLGKGIRFGGIHVPPGFSGIDVSTDAGDVLHDLQQGEIVDFSPGVTRFVVQNIPLQLDYQSFHGDEFPLGIRFLPENLQASFSISAHANVAAAPDLGQDSGDATLMGPFPNPASRTLSLGVRTRKPGHLTLTILDISGRVVRRVFDGSVEPGVQMFQWDLRHESGELVRPGVYMMRVDDDVHLHSRRIVVR